MTVSGISRRWEMRPLVFAFSLKWLHLVPFTEVSRRRGMHAYKPPDDPLCDVSTAIKGKSNVMMRRLLTNSQVATTADLHDKVSDYFVRRKRKVKCSVDFDSINQAFINPSGFALVIFMQGIGKPLIFILWESCLIFFAPQKIPKD